VRFPVKLPVTGKKFNCQPTILPELSEPRQSVLKIDYSQQRRHIPFQKSGVLFFNDHNFNQSYKKTTPPQLGDSKCRSECPCASLGSVQIKGNAGADQGKSQCTSNRYPKATLVRLANDISGKLKNKIAATTASPIKSGKPKTIKSELTHGACAMALSRYRKTVITACRLKAIASLIANLAMRSAIGFFVGLKQLFDSLPINDLLINRPNSNQHSETSNISKKRPGSQTYQQATGTFGTLREKSCQTQKSDNQQRRPRKPIETHLAANGDWLRVK
jgi:hypothetical protein